SISQMDVPTRQSYIVAAVSPDERSAAAGVTGVARTTGAALAPALAGLLLGSAALTAAPFVLAGALKLVSGGLLDRLFLGKGAPGTPAARRLKGAGGLHVVPERLLLVPRTACSRWLPHGDRDGPGSPGLRRQARSGLAALARRVRSLHLLLGPGSSTARRGGA